MPLFPPGTRTEFGFGKIHLTGPGTVLLLASHRNEPLGLRRRENRGSATSLQSAYSRASSRSAVPTKKTSDGRVILDPQPDDSGNDPLNWPVWRRDAALIALGFYSLMGGGMTPVLAAGFQAVATTYDVSTQQVAFTTGLYMLGLGVGSVIMSPTAILYGKRPVYLLGATLFIISAVWCAASPNFASLVVARVFQGIAVSPVECLPSATIAEIYFLHERAYRVGIYTLLLLGGKNLVPLVSAAIIGRMGWRWVFWIVAIVVGVCLAMIFFFMPETFWDRTPRPRPRKRPSFYRSVSDVVTRGFHGRPPHTQRLPDSAPEELSRPPSPAHHADRGPHVGFTDETLGPTRDEKEGHGPMDEDSIAPAPPAAGPREVLEKSDTDHHPPPPAHGTSHVGDLEAARPAAPSSTRSESVGPTAPPITTSMHYTNQLRDRSPVPFVQSLQPWQGRISHDSWIRAAYRPFVLFAYPAVLWSAAVYALSVGWLIVVSESVSHIFQGRSHYHFTSLQTGLVYISPFVGGLLGTAVAGRVSDLIVTTMTRRNGGVYEPEFRLVMAVPVALSTTAGLMAFGWSAEEEDHWIVPTVFFGLISFGCCLGSTTAITFVVDSYRQFAAEALVTLNWCKSMLIFPSFLFPFSSCGYFLLFTSSRSPTDRSADVFHGLVFSLFIVDWLDAQGSRTVYLALGGIQLGSLFLTIPMYMYGKRARMWTVRRRMMERF